MPLPGGTFVLASRLIIPRLPPQRTIVARPVVRLFHRVYRAFAIRMSHLLAFVDQPKPRKPTMRRPLSLRGPPTF